MSRINRTREQLDVLRHGAFPEAVSLEMRLQDDHWGEPVEAGRNSWAEWMLILGSEYGEAADFAGELHWLPFGYNEFHLDSLRVRLIQIAAVCGQMVRVIDAMKDRGNANSSSSDDEGDER